MAALCVAFLVLDPPFWLMIPIMAIGVASLDAIRAAMLASAVDLSERSEGTTLALAFVMMDGVGAFGAVSAGMPVGVAWQIMFALAATFALTAYVLSAKCTECRRKSCPAVIVSRLGSANLEREDTPA
ncbi:hypothetical protein LZ188_20740 [Rhodovulum sulfidophilum]|nr:hypothetical protein [Rhodovulum sulfidophilum]